VGPLIIAMGVAAAPAAGCAERPGDRAAIERTVHDFYDALGRDDRAAFRRLLTPDFVAFEFAERFTADTLFSLVADAHREGVTIRWTIGPMTIRVDCQTAWAQWDNRGSSGKSGAMRPRRWLETAVFRRDGRKWKVEMFHSTSAADPAPVAR